MKKKIFGGIAVLAIAAVAALNLNFNTQSNDFSVVSLTNVEALAQYENADAKYEYRISGTYTVSDGKGGTVSFPYTQCGGLGELSCS